MNVLTVAWTGNIYECNGRDVSFANPERCLGEAIKLQGRACWGLGGDSYTKTNHFVQAISWCTHVASRNFHSALIFRCKLACREIKKVRRFTVIRQGWLLRWHSFFTDTHIGGVWSLDSSNAGEFTCLFLRFHFHLLRDLFEGGETVPSLTLPAITFGCHSTLLSYYSVGFLSTPAKSKCNRKEAKWIPTSAQITVKVRVVSRYN